MAQKTVGLNVGTDGDVLGLWIDISVIQTGAYYAFVDLCPEELADLAVMILEAGDGHAS